MTLTKHKIMFLTAVFSILLFGCENVDQSDRDAIIETLDQMIMDSEHLGIDEFDEGGALEEEFGNITDDGLMKTLENYYPADSLRFRFGRRVTSHSRTVSHEFFGDTLVLATIDHAITGDFITVIFDTTGALVDSFSKPFDITAVRKVKFERIDNTSNRRRNWQLAGLTPLVSGAGYKVDIDSVKFVATDGTILFNLESEGIVNLFISPDEIPEFTTGDSVTVLLYVSNTGPEYDWKSGEGANLRVGRGRRTEQGHLHLRRHLFDDGENGGDAVANDNEFTRIWRMHPPGFGHQHRVFKLFLDVIDYETLFSSDGDYNASLWGFPYKSVR
ncbi:MAG: hypothetical protein ACE5EE_09420 [Fidelibacterota bacterium]